MQKIVHHNRSKIKFLIEITKSHELEIKILLNDKIQKKKSKNSFWNRVRTLRNFLDQNFNLTTFELGRGGGRSLGITLRVSRYII